MKKIFRLKKKKHIETPLLTTILTVVGTGTVTFRLAPILLPSAALLLAVTLLLAWFGWRIILHNSWKM
jgi:hypothetical protein